MTETLHLALPYFPPISWMAFAVQQKRIAIEACEYFPKSTIRNHLQIAAAKGALKLSVPVHMGRSHHQLYRDTQISYESNWQQQHWKSISSAYNRSPYFEFYKDELLPFFSEKESSLFQHNLNVLKKLIQLMRLPLEIEMTGVYAEDLPADLDGRMAYGRKSGALQLTPYMQVFSDRHGFIPDLSVLDLLCNMGPDAGPYLMKQHLPAISSLYSK